MSNILKHYHKPENKTDDSDFTNLVQKSTMYQMYKNYPSVSHQESHNIEKAINLKQTSNS